MIKKLSNLMVFVLLSFILLFPVGLVLTDQPVIASRISQITEISVITDSSYDKPNNTLFRINVSVEILNRNSENFTVYENADYDPKILINASFVNQTLGLEPIIICSNAGTEYTYPPAITKEYESIKFFINQSDLSCLPDGNYTIIRPINTAFNSGMGESAEILPTLIQVTSGIVNITYTLFDYYPTEQTDFTIILPLSILMLTLLVIHKNRKRKR